MAKTILFSPALQQATGRFDYPLTNDYMFRALCQENNKALIGLISALLHIPPKQIHSIKILNPIIVGDACLDKEFRLDVCVILNDNKVINLEIQVANLYDWPERSISYLCRVFDNLVRGDKYIFAKPAIHISILDFTLFPKHPMFYSQNKLMDIKTHHIYSDKFALNVLDLNKVEMATDEDKKWKLDYWARLFKATTWEEIKMIASNDEYLKEASNTLYNLNSDYFIRERCRNREEYQSVLSMFQDRLKESENEVQKKELEIEKLREEIEKLKSKNNK